jgi:hypothetical protein
MDELLMSHKGFDKYYISMYPHAFFNPLIALKCFLVYSTTRMFMEAAKELDFMLVIEGGKENIV